MSDRLYPSLVATSVSEWSRVAIDSLTLVATPTELKQASGYRTQGK